jgi:hypothetical protein
MATSPPGFTSYGVPKTTRALRAVESIQLPPSGLSAKTASIQSEFLKARVAFARLEAEILDRYRKTLRERDLTPDTVADKAPEYADDYRKAWTRKEEARVAYEALAQPPRTSRAAAAVPVPPFPKDYKVPSLPAAGLTQSTVFKGLVAGRKRTTRKPRKTRKHGPSRVLRHGRGRVSRRKTQA